MSTHGWPEESNAEQAESLIQSRDWWKRRWTESQDRIRELEAALGQAVSLLDVLDFQDDAGYVPKFKALLTSKERSHER